MFFLKARRYILRKISSNGTAKFCFAVNYIKGMFFSKRIV